MKENGIFMILILLIISFNCEKIILSKKSFLTTNNKISQNNDNHLEKNNLLIKNELMKSFKKLSKLSFDSSDLMGIYLNGNLTINHLEGNVDTQLTNNNAVIDNSNNVDHSSKNNVNSYNSVSKKSTKGNVVEKINSGIINSNNNLPENTSNYPPSQLSENRSRERSENQRNYPNGMLSENRSIDLSENTRHYPPWLQSDNLSIELSENQRNYPLPFGRVAPPLMVCSRRIEV